MNSNHQPKNTTIPLPPGSIAQRAEIFWQTTNCEHFMANYQVDSAKVNLKEKVHNLRFSDVSNMLSGNVLITPVPKSPHRYRAISYWNENYYLTIFTLQRRPQERLTLFAVVITTYITYANEHINSYREYVEIIRQKYSR